MTAEAGTAPVGPDGLAGTEWHGWGAYRTSVHRWARVMGRHAPPPSIPGRRTTAKLNPALTEWMMGLPDGWVTGVPGVDINAALKLCGNGVVPQQGAAALAWLLRAMHGEVWRPARRSPADKRTRVVIE